VLLCANKYEPSDKEDHLLLVALLADKNKRFALVYILLLLKISLRYIITIRPHFCAVNTSLLQKEQEKEMDP